MAVIFEQTGYILTILTCDSFVYDEDHILNSDNLNFDDSYVYITERINIYSNKILEKVSLFKYLCRYLDGISVMDYEDDDNYDILTRFTINKEKLTITDRNSGTYYHIGEHIIDLLIIEKINKSI